MCDMTRIGSSVSLYFGTDLMKSLIPPYSLAYKKRVYSANRILYPLKRVDWDPDGAR